MRNPSNSFARLSAGRLAGVVLAAALALISTACGSDGGPQLPPPMAGMMWIPGTGNVAGQLGATGAGGARAFPTQACLTKATEVLAMMTGDEKIAQLHQVERANTTAADITQHGVGSVYSQGGSAPTTNTPTGWPT